MTEYSYGDKTLTELSGNDFSERNDYFEQALKAYQQSPYNMTFLPISKDADPSVFYFHIVPEYGNYIDSSESNAYKYILQKTLEATFAKGDAELNSKLIATMGFPYDGNDYQDRANSNDYRDIVLAASQEFLSKNRWLDDLDDTAKMTLLDIGVEKDSRLVKQMQNITFNIPGKNFPGSYKVSKLCEHILSPKDDFLRSPANRKDNLSWNMKAELLKAYAQTYGKNACMLATFADLLQTAEAHDGSSFSRAERVAKLTEAAEKISESFDFQHNYHGIVKGFPQNWAELVPACDEAQKLFYTCLYKMHFPEPNNFPRNSLNFQAFQNAKQEVAAQRTLDDLSKYKRGGLSPNEMQLLIRFRPQELIAYKHFSPETQFSLLKNLGSEIPESKRLSMMSRYVAAVLQKDDRTDNRIDDKNLTFLLDSALKMKTVSSEMKKFIQTISPLVDKQAARYKYKKEKLEYILQKQKQKDAADAEMQKFTQAATALRRFDSLVYEVSKFRTDKEQQLSDTEIAKIVKNAINGKEPKQIEYAKQSGLSSLFSGKKEKERQQQTEAAVRNFNAFLPELAKYQDIFSKTEGDLTIRGGCSDFSHFYFLYKEVSKKQDDADRAYRATEYGSLAYYQQAVWEYEQNNPQEKLSQLTENLNSRTKELKTKARENLTFAFKGQEFTGESIFAEQKKSVRKAYKKKAEELKKRLKGAAKEEMSDRGVYEKPALEDDGKSAKKISKKTADKALKMLRDKKMYDKLSAEK